MQRIPKRLVVEGQAGAGKTPLCEALMSELQSRGLSPVYVHPIHEASEALGFDLFFLWQTHPHDAINRLRRQLLKPREAEVILFDRGWLTLQLALEGFGYPDLIEMAVSNVKWWTVFLDVSLEVVEQRSTFRGKDGVLFDLTWDREHRSLLAPSCELVLQSARRADMALYARKIVDQWMKDTNSAVSVQTAGSEEHGV